LLAALLGVIVGRSSAERERPDWARERDELQSQLAGLENRLRHVQSGSARAMPASRPRTQGDRGTQSGAREGAYAPSSDVRERSDDPVLAREEARMAADRRVELIEEHFAAEQVDRTWANDARAIVETAAASPQLAGSRIAAVECRSTLCRIQVEHDSERDAEVWSDVFYGEAVALPRGYQRRLEAQDDVQRTLVFLARPGHGIPRERGADGEDR
jgi:hypothetical protein